MDILNKMFFAAPNYWIAFVLCLSGTVMAALTKNPEWHWLLVSDANVAIWLLVAYWLDPNKNMYKGQF